MAEKPLDLVRASFYLLASAAVWFAEGYIFSTFLDFSFWQIVLTFVVYAALFAIAAAAFVRFARTYRPGEDGLAPWRALAWAPVMVAIIGSFCSLPVLLLIAALGAVD
jgi:hypothetical protein